MEIKVTIRNLEDIKDTIYMIRREIDTVGVITTATACAWAGNYSHPLASHLYGWTREDNVKILMDIVSPDGPSIRIDPEPKLLQKIGSASINLKSERICGDVMNGLAGIGYQHNVIEAIKLHADISQELHDIYIRKYRRIDRSLHAMYAEKGFSMTRVWFADKFAEFKMQTMNKEKGEDVSDESIRAMLLDIANYAIMTIMEIDREDSHGD